MVSIFLFVELFKNCALAPVQVKAFLDMSRSHCHVFCHALHALQYATNKHLSINRSFVFIGKIPTVKGQKIKSGYKQLLDEVFVISILHIKHATQSSDLRRSLRVMS